MAATIASEFSTSPCITSRRGNSSDGKREGVRTKTRTFMPAASACLQISMPVGPVAPTTSMGRDIDVVIV
jgi:hypothetical protein